MLPRAYKLPAPRIRYVLKEGKRVRFGAFDMVFLPSMEFGAAVVVSTTVDKRAVVRHKLKRFVFDTIQSELSHMKPVQLVVIVRSSSLLVSQENGKRSFLTAFSQCGFLL